MPSDSRATLQPALARYSTRWKVCSQSSLSKMPSAASLLSMGTHLPLPGKWRERGQGKESKEGSKEKRVRRDYQRQTPTESRERESEILRFALLQIRKLHLASVDDQRRLASRWVQLREVPHPCFLSSLKLLSYIHTQSGRPPRDMKEFLKVFLTCFHHLMSWSHTEVWVQLKNILCPQQNPLNFIPQGEI